jgi:hypothetical protein
MSRKLLSSGSVTILIILDRLSHFYDGVNRTDAPVRADDARLAHLAGVGHILSMGVRVTRSPRRHHSRPENSFSDGKPQNGTRRED